MCGPVKKLSLSQAKTYYYSSLICHQQSHSRLLDWLLHPLDPPHPSGAPDLCYYFLDVFWEKLILSISSLRQLHIGFRISSHLVGCSFSFFSSGFLVGHQVDLSGQSLHMHSGPHADTIGQAMSVATYRWYHLFLLRPVSARGRGGNINETLTREII